MLDEALAAPLSYATASRSDSFNPYSEVWQDLRADVAKLRARAASPVPASATVVGENESAVHASSTTALTAADDDGILAGVGPSSGASSSPALSILSDTTVRWLSLITPSPANSSEDPKTPTIAVSNFTDSTNTTPLVTPSQMFRRRRSFSFNDSPSYNGAGSLAVLHEHEAGSTSNATPSAPSAAGKENTNENGNGNGNGALNNSSMRAKAASSASLTSFLPEDDEFLQSFSAAGFFSPSQESGLGSLVGGETGGLAQSLVKPAALGLGATTTVGTPPSSPRKSIASGVGSISPPTIGGGGMQMGRPSIGSSPLKRKTTVASSAGAGTTRRRGSTATDTTDYLGVVPGSPNPRNGTSGAGGGTSSPRATTMLHSDDAPSLVIPPSKIELDEALVDTWADTLLDERMASEPQMWPNFALFQLKTPRVAGIINGGEKIEWLVVEQHVCTTPPPPPPPPPAAAESVAEAVSSSSSGGAKSPKAGKRSTSPSRVSTRTSTSRVGRFGSPGRPSRNRFSQFFGGLLGSKGDDEDREQEEEEKEEVPPVPVRPETPTPQSRGLPSSTLAGAAVGGAGAALLGKSIADEDKINPLTSATDYIPATTTTTRPPYPPPLNTDVPAGPVPFPMSGGSSLVEPNDDFEPVPETELTPEQRAAELEPEHGNQVVPDAHVTGAVGDDSGAPAVAAAVVVPEAQAEEAAENDIEPVHDIERKSEEQVVEPASAY